MSSCNLFVCCLFSSRAAVLCLSAMRRARGGDHEIVRFQEEAIYEDDEMYGGFGSPAPPAGPGDVKVPFRATFDKEDSADKK